MGIKKILETHILFSYWGFPIIASVICVLLAFYIPLGPIWKLFFVGWPGLLLFWLVFWSKKRVSIVREIYYMLVLFVSVFIASGVLFWLVGGMLELTREKKQEWSEYVGFLFWFLFLLLAGVKVWRRIKTRQN